ncbi:MAG: hypothetical protein IH603_00020 [Burkholderia vietnamiensis]|nr:hypothetical protein [Burkholderia vietnamiensis]
MSNERDEFHGVGGSYVLDPKTKTRRRVDAPQVMPEGGGARGADGKLLEGAQTNVETAQSVAEPPAASAAAPAADEKPAGEELKAGKRRGGSSGEY